MWTSLEQNTQNLPDLKQGLSLTLHLCGPLFLPFFPLPFQRGIVWNRLGRCRTYVTISIVQSSKLVIRRTKFRRNSAHRNRSSLPKRLSIGKEFDFLRPVFSSIFRVVESSVFQVDSAKSVFLTCASHVWRMTKGAAAIMNSYFL